jgi:glycosyltransferase involved in cell wall biosynthesis
VLADSPAVSRSAAVPSDSPISVVIPAYNYAQYLPEAVESVLAQTHRHLECIVVDDGSVDNTRAVVSAIHDERLRYVHQANAGLSSARNTGIREAKHAFIGFLDADDRWLPEFAARALQELYLMPGKVGAVATASFRIDGHGARVNSAQFTFGKSCDLTFRDFCLRSRPLSSSILIRKEALQQCGDFNIGLRSSEDRDYWLRMTALGWKIRFVDEPLAEIRRHPMNMSKAAVRMQENRRQVLAHARGAGVILRHSPFWLKVHSAHLLQSARAHHTEGSTSRAVLLLTGSCLLWPWFLAPAELSERPLFRARALARMVLDRWKGPHHE